MCYFVIALGDAQLAATFNYHTLIYDGGKLKEPWTESPISTNGGGGICDAKMPETANETRTTRHDIQTVQIRYRDDEYVKRAVSHVTSFVVVSWCNSEVSIVCLPVGLSQLRRRYVQCYRLNG